MYYSANFVCGSFFFFSVPILVAINKCDRPNADPVSSTKYMHMLIDSGGWVVLSSVSSAGILWDQSGKLKGGICKGGHIAITYGSKLYLQNYFELSLPSNFVKLSCVELITHAERFSCSRIHGNDNVNRLLQMTSNEWQMWKYNNSAHAHQNGSCLIS